MSDTDFIFPFRLVLEDNGTTLKSEFTQHLGPSLHSIIFSYSSTC